MREIQKEVIETKYYTKSLIQYFDESRLRAQHIAQLYTYLKQLENKSDVNKNVEGILLYPEVTEEIEIKQSIEGHKFTIRTINLANDWQYIHRELMKIVS